MSEIHFQINLNKDSFPDQEELEARNMLETLLEKQIGEVVDAGAGKGFMDVWVEVDDLQESLEKAKKLIKQIKLDDITEITTR